jgi:hypothetical protein
VCVCFQLVFRPSQLSQLVSIFHGCALRPNTKSTYTSLINTYNQLCHRAGLNPARPHPVDSFAAVCILYSLNHKITSLPVFLSAVASHYKDQRWEFPSSTRLQAVVKGIKNYFAHQSASSPRTAITIDNLVALRSGLNLNSFTDARDWCAYLFAFFGLLRVGEYTNGSLRMADFERKSDRIRLTIPYSKTALRPVQIDIAARSDSLDPCSALDNLLRFYPSCLLKPSASSTSTSSSSSPSFSSISSPLFLLAPCPGSNPLSDQIFSQRLRSLISRCITNVDPRQFAGHSFRRGGATALYLAGVPEADIKRHGRWKSEAVRLYMDSQHNDDVRLNPTRILSRTSPSQLRPAGSAGCSSFLTDIVESELDV